MNKRILLIDDDETTNFISKLVLKSAGIEDVSEAINVMDALSYLERDCPDIIFLDINMPIMDGWAFLEEQKTKKLCGRTKVAMLTSSARPEDKQKAQGYASVIAYLEKPLTEDKIRKLEQKLAS